MNNKAVVFTDWHIHDYKMYSDKVDRLDNSLRVLEEIANFCEKYGIDIIFFSGDLFDTHKALLTQVVNKTTEAFANFFERLPDMRFYAITGNHDQASKNLIGKEAISAIDYLVKAFPINFISVDNKTMNVDIGGDNMRISVTGIPYYEYPEHFDQKLNDAIAGTEEVFAERRYLLMHQTPKGIGNDMIPADCNPHDPRFKKFDLVLNGHIHKRQQLADNFHVIGSPIHRDLADAGEEKGFYVLNLEKPDKFKFIYLSGFPEFEEVYDGEFDTEMLQDDKKYVVVKTRPSESVAIKDAKVAEFSTDLKDRQLVENYWKEVDGKDEELLAVGLSFLT